MVSPLQDGAADLHLKVLQTPPLHQAPPGVPRSPAGGAGLDPGRMQLTFRVEKLHRGSLITPGRRAESLGGSRGEEPGPEGNDPVQCALNPQPGFLFDRGGFGVQVKPPVGRKTRLVCGVRWTGFSQEEITVNIWKAILEWTDVESVGTSLVSRKHLKISIIIKS